MKKNTLLIVVTIVFLALLTTTIIIAKTSNKYKLDLQESAVRLHPKAVMATQEILDLSTNEEECLIIKIDDQESKYYYEKLYSKKNFKKFGKYNMILVESEDNNFSLLTANNLIMLGFNAYAHIIKAENAPKAEPINYGEYMPDGLITEESEKETTQPEIIVPVQGGC